MRTPRFAFVAVAAATALVLAACNGDEDGGGDAADEGDFGHLLRSRVGGQPRQRAGCGMTYHHRLSWH